jgi:hypothetical protein
MRCMPNSGRMSLLLPATILLMGVQYKAKPHAVLHRFAPETAYICI